MTLKRLDWILWKQRDIVNQIREIVDKDKIRTIGEFPEWMTPQHLINFQRERYSILETIKSCKEETLRKWLDEARNRIVANPDLDFPTIAEIDLLENCLQK